jgi:hypothetical protein
MRISPSCGLSGGSSNVLVGTIVGGHGGNLSRHGPAQPGRGIESASAAGLTRAIGRPIPLNPVHLSLHGTSPVLHSGVVCSRSNAGVNQE